MFFENEKENLDNIQDLGISDDELISWDLDEEAPSDDLVSIKDETSRPAPAPMPAPKSNDDLPDLASLDFDDDLQLVGDPDDDVEEEYNTRETTQQIDDVDDAELAKILSDDSENVTPSKQKAFDTFGTKNEDNSPNDYFADNNDSQGEIEFQEENQDIPDFSEVVPEEEFSEDNVEIDEEVYTEPETQSKNSCLIPLFMAALLAICVVAAVYFVFVNKNLTINLLQKNNDSNQQQQEETTTEQNDIPVVNDENVDTLKLDEENEENILENKEKTEVIDVQSAGRVNPFMPIDKYNPTIISPDTTDEFGLPKLPSKKAEPIIRYNYDASGIPKAPTQFGTQSELATKLMSVTVSGILYDAQNPSAIITLEGNDYFVQKGDMLDKYKIIEITRNSVKMTLDKNIYKANLGEEFKLDSIYGNAAFIPQNQGGGRKYQLISADEESKNQYTSEEDVQIRSSRNSYKKRNKERIPVDEFYQ